MTATILDSSQPLTDLQLERVEKEVGFPLPDQYKEFLKQYNGGYPDPDAFLFLDKSDGSSVDRFLSLDAGEDDDLFVYLKRYAGRTPSDMMPIAHDPGGNLVLIGLSDSNRGQVFFWDHEYEDEDPGLSNVSLVSVDLKSFLDSLYEIDV